MKKYENISMVDSRLKNKIESLMDCSEDKNKTCCSVRFKDLDDTFWFDDKDKLQEFLNNQASERYYDKSLRKGYFDYINENMECLRYYVESNRGTLTLLREENIGVTSK